MGTTAKAALVLGSLVAVGLIWKGQSPSQLSGPELPPDMAAPISMESGSIEAHEQHLYPDTTSEPVELTKTTQRIVVPENPSPRPEDTAPPAENGLLLGRIDILEGVEWVPSKEDGQVTLMASIPNPAGPAILGKDHSVPVLGGHFEFRLPEQGDHILLHDVELGGHQYLCDIRFRFRSIVPSQVVPFRATRKPRAWLHALDQQTLEHLGEVTVIQASPGKKHQILPLPKSTIVSKDGVSPVQLPYLETSPSRRHMDVLVHSPGYAWQRATITEQDPDPTVVHLRPGGNFTVEITGPLTQESTLRMYPQGQHAHHRNPIGEWSVAEETRTRTVHGVLPGEYELSYELGSRHQPVNLGSVNFTQAAAKSELVYLATEPYDDIPTVPFAGTVHIPESWQIRRASLRVERLDRGPSEADFGEYFKLTAIPKTEDYSFDTKEVPMGRYKVYVNDTCLAWSHTLGIHGDPHASFALPEANKVLVEVTDGESGEILSEVYAMWIVTKPATGYFASSSPTHCSIRNPDAMNSTRRLVRSR